MIFPIHFGCIYDLILAGCRKEHRCGADGAENSSSLSFQQPLLLPSIRTVPARWFWSYDIRGWEEVQLPEAKTTPDAEPEEFVTQRTSQIGLF